MPSTINLGPILKVQTSSSLFSATQRTCCTWKGTKSTFQTTSTPLSTRHSSSSSFLSFCPISVRKPPSAAASNSPSSQVDNENGVFFPIEQTTPNPSNISKAVSTAAATADNLKHNSNKAIEFNLPWAVALARAAFEAYSDVAEPAELVQKCPGGVEITYTNQEFLIGKMAGIVEVSIEKISLTSSSLVDEETNQEKKEEFVFKLSIGDSCLELQPCVSSSSASSAASTGNSGFLFVRNLERDRLSVRVFDRKKEEEVGVASLIASEFVEAFREKKKKKTRGEKKSKTIEISLDLQDTELNSIGFVHLKLVFKPFSDVFVAEKTSQGELNLLGAPGPALMSDSWQQLTRRVFEASAAALGPVAFIENHDTDTQVWVFINKSLKMLVVSFRGTVQDSWRDLLTDISMTPISLDTGHFKESPRHAHLAKLSAKPGTIDKVVHTVAHAKKEIELKKKSAKQTTKNAALQENKNAAMKSREEAEKEAEGLVFNAVDAFKTTATDIQQFLARLKHLIDQGAIEGPIPSTASSANNRPGSGGIWVHSGFLTAYDSVRGAVLGLIDTSLDNSSSISQENAVASSPPTPPAPENSSSTIFKGEKDEEEGNWTVLFTGHSLGGALATLAAFDLSHRSSSSSNSKPRKIAMYNFGSPRVGNKAFAIEFNRAVPHAWRLVNRNDAVVTVPRLVGYCHVGHAVIVGKDPGEAANDKKIEVQLHTSEAPFEGMAVVDEVLPAVGAAITHSVTQAVARAVPAVIKGVGLEIAEAAGQEEETVDGQKSINADQLAEYWEQEKEAWTALFQGAAISEHMEEFYFKGIEDAVEEWRRQNLRSSIDDDDSGAVNG